MEKFKIEFGCSGGGFQFPIDSFSKDNNEKLEEEFQGAWSEEAEKAYPGDDGLQYAECDCDDAAGFVAYSETPFTESEVDETNGIVYWSRSLILQENGKDVFVIFGVTGV